MIRSKEARHRRLGLLVLAASAFVVALVPGAGAHEPFGDAIISNGVVQLGVHSIANLNVPGGTPSSGTGTTTVGLRYVPTNAESTAPGCHCEGWGAADASTGLTGYANQASGTSNVTAVSFSSSPSTAVSVVDIDNEGQTMRVTHDYHPSAATPNLYEVTVTIENVGSSDIGDLRYRRVMDWDVEPTAFDEFSTINGRAFPNLLFTSNDGFATANPLGGPEDIGHTGFFTDAGPDDHGALFDFGFGALKPGEKTTFNTYYGAAGNETDAVSAVGAVGAEVWSFGQPSSSDPTVGTPNTFIFAFGSVGGEPFAGRDPRPPLQLDVFAPDEIGSGEAFTVRSVVSNVGDGNATGVTTRIELGPGLALDSGEPSRSIGTLTPGQSREESFVVRTPSDCADRVYSYDIFADYAERAEGETERHVSEMIVVRGTGCPDTTPPPPPPPPQEPSPPPPPPPPAPADLNVDVRSDPTGTVAAGTLVSYLVTITNNGPGTAHNVVGSHAAPAGAEFVSVSSDHNAAFSRRQTGPGCSGTTTVTCSLGTLVVGEQAHITHVVRLTTAGSASSSASASASEADPTPANNTSSVTVTVGPATPPGGGSGGTGGQLPPPVVGETVNVRPVGNVFVVRPDGTRVPLTDPSQLTFPVTIDVSAPGARVTLTVATAGGGTETATFYGGVFNVDQNLVATPARSTASLAQSVALTELALRGGNFAQCNAPAKGKAKGKGKKSRSLSSVEQRSNKPVRRLWGNGKGNFRTRGRYSSATVRGTIWLTQDQCNGTLTRVTQGVVLVNDFTRKRQQLVRAGKSYLALAPKGKR